MTYDLYIGDRLFSSWSLRGWLMFEKFAIPYSTHMIGLYSCTMAQDLVPLVPARLVPAMRTPDGIVVGESLAMAETLAERHPDAGLCAEMTAGFGALRDVCRCNWPILSKALNPPQKTLADLARIETLWSHARTVANTPSGWLFGNYSLADVFHTPVAARIIGFDLPVSQAYRGQNPPTPSFILLNKLKKRPLQRRGVNHS